ncbi:uncharacterized protein LOC113215051 [Frankliniella occidentalis]|uniref:Uncharacterized protein LOC113215051 n=1 Tax=Frankliniella occidentalis TaxID=133901 RepID=A0A9C6U5B9_FRAOC|nr:uncharacterized protein LOC113215051 [Frankliniella occidentalis]
MDWPAEGTRETVRVAEGLAEVTCMGADGNCLFHAVSHQLRAVGGVQDAAELRWQAAAYIRANPDQFEAALDAAAADDPQGYAPYRDEGGRLADIPGAAGRLASRLERDSEWAGEEALVALAAVYQTRIEVYSEARPGSAPPCRPVDPPDVRPGPPLRTLRVVYRLSRAGGGQRVHYDSLQSCTPAPAEEEEGRSTRAQPGSGPQRDPPPADDQPRMPEELQEVVLALRRGPLSPGRLTGALLLAMRRGNEEHFVELGAAAGPAVGWPALLEDALEDALDEAWRTARALNLPLSEDMQRCVVSNLTLLRYQDPTSGALPAAHAHVRWHELWGRVHLLLEYSRRLQDELQRLQGHDRAPGSADKSVMLARMCALAVHNVKGSFLATYKDVPWEEMEYLLVMFIEERTVFATLAHAVATASTAAHLRCFRERLEKYVLVHRAEPDPEAAMRRLKKESQKERADLSRVVDSALTDLRKDFALLRDWYSLKEINETLGVTSEALSLQDTDWAAWGWLALRWALFVVGERAKYSWTSPNLSPRWAVLVEAMAPGGVLKVMSAVRDDQEHGEEGSNAKTLALPKKAESKRKELAEELQKLTRAARAALGAAEGEVEWTDDRDWEGKERVTAAKTDSDKDLIGEELLKILEPAKHKAEPDFERISTLVRRQIESPLGHFSLSSMSLLFAREHIPEAVPRVFRLLLHKSAEHTASFQAELRDVTPSVSSPLDTLRRALTALAAAPVARCPLPTIFAINGALRELASRWHEHDKVTPTDLPFSPALFGRQLRNYLNHLDEVFRSPLELQALSTMLHNKRIPLEHGARPRLRDLRWSRAENERLLRLVELKSDMFRCAREGYLFWLQRLVEDGADVSARDCQDRTLLHAAAQGGQAHVVRWLLGLGAEAVDPLAGDWRGCTALHVARTAAVAEALLAANKTAYSDLQQSWTPLHAAALCGRAEVVAVLLRDPRGLNAEYKGWTPLHCAAHRGHDQVVRLLLAVGARYQANAHGHTPLVLAAYSGSAPTVRLLLGAAPRPDDEDCWRAAAWAAKRAREEACSALLDELEARGLLQWGPEARKVLLEAGRGGSSAITLRLLDLPSAALSERLHDNGRTVLHAAARNGRAELVRALLSRGADPLGEDADGNTALDLAAAGGSPDTITALVEHIPGGSLQAALTRALCVAALSGELGAAQRLVHHGADVSAVDGAGVTPLSSAAYWGHTEVVQWLLLRGADPRPGRVPPLHQAAAYGRLGVVKLLVPPLHAGDQAQDDPGGEEPGPEDILHDSRFWLLLMTRPERKAEESAEKRRKQEARMAQEAQAVERLGLLQQVSEGRTPLHWATNVSALPVVEYLLKREEELLRYVHSLRRPTGEPTVYARDADGRTALQYGAMGLCAPSVAEALLKRMGDKVWLARGHRDLQEVRGMAVEALEKAVTKPGSGRLVRALCGWLLGEKEEDKKKDKKDKKEDRLWDIRLAAVAALCSGPDEEWRAVVDLVRWHLEALPVNLADLRRCAVRVMRRCLQLGPLGEKALQLLSLWVRDLRGLSEGARDETHETVLRRIVYEALRISAQRGDQDSVQAIWRSLERMST